MYFLTTFENLCVLTCSLFITAITAVVLYNFRYWKNRGVPTVEELTISSITLSPLNLTMYIGEYFKSIYATAKQLGYKHVGGFLCSKPIYFVLDPEHIKNILQRDFDHFIERGFYCNGKHDPLSSNLFAIGGDTWRTLRKHLSPAFTSGKLKLLFDSMLQCAYQMKDAVEEGRRDKRPINSKDICEKYIIDVFGSCLFGLECDSFKNVSSELREQSRKIFHFTIWRMCKVFLVFSFPALSNRLGIRIFEDDTTKFFFNIVKDMMEYRKYSIKTQKDFFQLLSEMQGNNKLKQLPFSVEKLTAVMFGFFAAGFETSSITLMFCLYEMAINRDVQDRLREEIHQVVARNGGKITYDAIMDMKYMNQVVEETLRKYPPVTFIIRVCTKDYNIPNTTFVIEKGIHVFVPVLGLHRDAEYYPNPDVFDPERFSYENRTRIRPFTFLPFGEGPRFCIGMRFGLLQVKAGLAVLLNEYQFTLSDKSKVPLEMKIFSLTMTPKENIFLDVVRNH